jgi:hypothetical protein
MSLRHAFAQVKPVSQVAKGTIRTFNVPKSTLARSGHVPNMPFATNARRGAPGFPREAGLVPATQNKNQANGSVVAAGREEGRRACP